MPSYRTLVGLSGFAGLAVCLALPVSADTFTPTAQERFVPPDAKLELLWGEGEFTEGPVAAIDGSILFSDIGNRIMRYDPKSGDTGVYRSPSGKSNGLMFDRLGRLVACEGAGEGGNRRISINNETGRVMPLADNYDGKKFNSPNDLAVTKKGGVYFTDPRYVGEEPRELDFEGVFYVAPDRTVHVATREVEKPNGILASPDGETVYVSDNNNQPEGNHQLTAFSVRPDGTLSDKRVLFDFGPNRRGIDGMTLDVEGNIYAAAGRGDDAGIYVFSPEGKPLAFVKTPGGPTNCTFGIRDEASTLFVTAPSGKPAEEGKRPPYGLYRIRLTKNGYHVYPRR